MVMLALVVDGPVTLVVALSNSDHCKQESTSKDLKIME